MSIAAIDAVFKDARTRGSCRMVLLALANHANDEYVSWPSVKTLARLSKLGERMVQRCLRQLVTEGLIEVLESGGRGPRATTRYRLLLGGSAESKRVSSSAPLPGAWSGSNEHHSARQRVSHQVSMGVVPGAQGCHAVRPNHQEPAAEPKENPKSRLDCESLSAAAVGLVAPANCDATDAVGTRARLPIFAGRSAPPASGPPPSDEVANPPQVHVETSPADRESYDAFGLRLKVAELIADDGERFNQVVAIKRELHAWLAEHAEFAGWLEQVALSAEAANASHQAEDRERSKAVWQAQEDRLCAALESARGLGVDDGFIYELTKACRANGQGLKALEDAILQVKSRAARIQSVGAYLRRTLQARGVM